MSDSPKKQNMKLGIGTSSVQMVLFTSALDLTDKIKVVSKLKALKCVQFDAEPVILPIPQDAPPEIPRIILKTKDDGTLLSISPSKIDLVINATKSGKLGIPEDKLENLGTSAIKKIDDIYDIFNENFSVKIKRIAIVTKQIIKFSSSSKDFLSSQIIKEKIESPFEIKIAYLYKAKIGGFKINKWRKIDTLRHKKNKNDDTALRLTYDINTTPEEIYDFDRKKIDNFFRLTLSLVEKETGLFFNKK